jgi:hypothetical protein
MSNTTTTKKTRGRPATKQATHAKERPTRIPMSGSRKRMHVDEADLDSNFHYAWINDQKDLIHRAKRAGYEHVTVAELPHWGTPDVDSAGSTSSLVSMKVNADTTSYYMKQPMEYYEEDQAEKDALVDAREADMKKNLNSGNEGTYGKVDFS